MKTCCGCGVEKSSSEFHKKGSRLAARCKPCTKIYRAEHYKVWSPEQRENLAQKNRERKERLQSQLREYKESRPCSDCKGFFHFAAMDFDHVSGNKRIDVSRLVNYGSWRRMLEEIQKCDLVCSNCHRVRTYTRMALCPSG